MEQTIFASKVYTGTVVLENQLITSSNGRIATIAPGLSTAADLQVQNLSAGFIDVHINGGNNFHFTQEASIRGVGDIDYGASALGTAYTLPSLITSPIENIFQGIQAIAAYRHSNPNSGVLGMHLEGPYLNPDKRGAHLLKYIKKPETKELQMLINAGKGHIRLLTIAPEMFSADQIKLLLDSGITISAGHSNATYEQASAAFALGIRLVTHLYNAMSPFQHRSPGLVGATFDHPEVYAPIILDNTHCDLSAASVAYKIKKEKLFLISDALFTGRMVKKFQWESFDARLIGDQYVNSEGNLAGATISLGEAVYNAVNHIGIPLAEAVEMVTSRPAAALGIGDSLGQIAVGYPARFTSFDDELQQFQVISYQA
jgi:N-acetylglucosamine-6-phosphate deacetylase